MGNLIFGLETMVIGFAVVMLTLFCLYLILVGFSRCLAKPVKTEPKTENKAVLQPQPFPLDETTAAPVAAAAVQFQLDEAVAAPIAAAAAAVAVVSRQYSGASPEIVAAISSVLGVCLDTQITGLYIAPAATTCPVASTTPWTLLGRKRLMERRQDLFLFRRERRK
jgi:Na+-transporting methylmalonyl-CoA/oxaloacetate decarboxylase gamma subunit